MKLYFKKTSRIKAFFDFIYNRLVIKNATLYVDNNNKLQISMPQNENKYKKKEPVCCFENKKDFEPLRYLAVAQYNKLISKMK